jgi:hypothetical protein
VWRIVWNKNLFKFTVTAATATLWDTYTNNGSTFTVKETIAAWTTLICERTTWTNDPAASGNLTRDTWAGTNPIVFSAWDSSSKKVADYIEYHVNDVSAATHLALHLDWSRYVNWLDIASNAIATGTPNTDWRNTVIGLSTGTVLDDNLHYTITNDSTPTAPRQQVLWETTPANLSATNSWLFKVFTQNAIREVSFLPATRFPFAWDVATNRPQTISTTWVRTLVPDNRWFVYFAYSTQNPTYWEAIKLVSAAAEFTSLANAQAYTWSSIQALYPTIFGNDFEIRPLYRIIFYNDNTWPWAYPAGCKYSVIREIQDIRKGSITSTAVATGSIPASAVTVVPAWSIGSTNVQSALEELDTEKEPVKWTDDNYVTDAQLVVIGNTSWTNTWDQTWWTPAITLWTANTAWTSPNFLRRDDTILAFDATALTAEAIGSTSSVGTATVASRRDHRHPMPSAATIAATIWTWYAACATAIWTQAKTLAITWYALLTGWEVAVKFTNWNSASAPTLNINSTWAKWIFVNWATIWNLPANIILDLVYDWTNYVVLNQSILGTTVATTQAYWDSAVAWTSLEAARIDHKHAMPASTKDTTAVTGILKGNWTTVSAAWDSDITDKLITGFTSWAWAVAWTDTILQSINKLDWNINAKVSNATHTGDVTWATALTIDKTAITWKTEVTAVPWTDYVLISDTSDSGNLKKALLPAGWGSGDYDDLTDKPIININNPDLDTLLTPWVYRITGTATSSDTTWAVYVSWYILQWSNLVVIDVGWWDYIQYISWIDVLSWGWASAVIREYVSSTRAAFDRMVSLTDDLGWNFILANWQTLSLTGTSTWKTQLATANTSATDYVATLPAKTGTIAMVGDITGTNSWTNTGDQTSIVGITGTKAQFDTAVTDWNILYVGDVTSNVTHTGDATGATALTLATVNSNVWSFTNANITVNAKWLITAAANGTWGWWVEPIRIRIPWEMVVDANIHQWIFRRNTTWATITISNVKIKVATAAAWAWASAAFNLYKSSWTDSNWIDTSAVALFSSAIDLTTSYTDDINVPNTATVEDWRWISLRCTASDWATNKASDVEVIIYYS